MTGGFGLPGGNAGTHRQCSTYSIVRRNSPQPIDGAFYRREIAPSADGRDPVPAASATPVLTGLPTLRFVVEHYRQRRRTSQRISICDVKGQERSSPPARFLTGSIATAGSE